MPTAPVISEYDTRSRTKTGMESSSAAPTPVNNPSKDPIITPIECPNQREIVVLSKEPIDEPQPHESLQDII